MKGARRLTFAFGGYLLLAGGALFAFPHEALGGFSSVDLILSNQSNPVTPSVAQRSRGALDFARAERDALLSMRTSPVFSVETTDLLWARVTGLLAAILGYFYFWVAKAQSAQIFRLSTHGRLVAGSAFFALAVRGIAPSVFYAVALIDLASALMTLLLLKPANTVVTTK